MTNQSTIKLNDGSEMPRIGLGVWQVPDEDAARIVEDAISAGYRSIDTASIYGNEAGVGAGIAAAGAAREDLFITTKLWNDRQGYDNALKAFDESLQRLKLDYVDLYPIHWPVAKQDLYAETWRALIRLKQEGRARSVGVSNFHIPHLERIVEETGVLPAVNQVELHPRLQQRDLRAFHAQRGIVTESWSPLGQGKILEDETLTALAQKHGRTPAQIILRWHLENDLVVIPKSVNPARVRENFAIFDFALDEEDRQKIAALDANGRVGPDPETFGN